MRRCGRCSARPATAPSSRCSTGRGGWSSRLRPGERACRRSAGTIERLAMRTLAPIASLVLLLASVTFAADAELKTDDDKTLYALGIALSRNLSVFSLKPNELELVKQGLTDGVLDREKKVDFDAYSGKIQSLAKARSSAAADVEKKAAVDFLEKAAAEKGAKNTASGLIITEIKPGTGDAPKASDRVKVHYHGT